MKFVIQFECDDATPDELQEALQDHCSSFYMPDGSHMLLSGVRVEHIPETTASN